VRGSDDIDGESLLSPKSMPWARLANSFSSEVSSWFIDVSSEETSSCPLSPLLVTPPPVSQRSWRSVVTSVIIREPKPLPHYRGLCLLLDLTLPVIVVGCHSLEKREFSEGESDWSDERERERANGTPAFIAAVGGIFEEMPR
jgi:hypothetical protein